MTTSNTSTQTQSLAESIAAKVAAMQAHSQASQSELSEQLSTHAAHSTVSTCDIALDSGNKLTKAQQEWVSLLSATDASSNLFESTSKVLLEKIDKLFISYERKLKSDKDSALSVFNDLCLATQSHMIANGLALQTSMIPNIVRNKIKNLKADEGRELDHNLKLTVIKPKDGQAHYLSVVPTEVKKTKSKAIRAHKTLCSFDQLDIAELVELIGSDSELSARFELAGVAFPKPANNSDSSEDALETYKKEVKADKAVKVSEKLSTAQKSVEELTDELAQLQTKLEAAKAPKSRLKLQGEITKVVNLLDQACETVDLAEPELYTLTDELRGMAVQAAH